MMQAIVPFTQSSARGAFERWILPHRRALFAQAQRLTGNPSDAEDLVQETLLRAYTRRDQLTGGETAAAWLYTMQRNLFINLYRKRQKAPTFTELTEDGVNIGSVQTLATESPETTITRRWEHSAVLEAMRTLPYHYREIIRLADIEQLPYQEIAEQMNLPIGTVRSRIARGRQKLQRTLWSWRSVGSDAYQPK